MDIKNVGGTPGGTGTFFLGAIMLVVGGYLLLHQVQVGGNYWNWQGIGGYGKTFGVTLIPLLFGIGILFFNGHSFAGRILTFGGALVILAGIILNLDMHFQQTSLYVVLTMLVLIVGGVGLIARSVLPMEPKQPPQVPPSPE